MAVQKHVEYVVIDDDYSGDLAEDVEKVTTIRPGHFRTGAGEVVWTSKIFFCLHP